MDSYPGVRMVVVETDAADDVVALVVRPGGVHRAFSLRSAEAAG